MLQAGKTLCNSTYLTHQLNILLLQAILKDLEAEDRESMLEQTSEVVEDWGHNRRDVVMSKGTALGLL